MKNTIIFIFSPEDTNSLRLSKRREYILSTNALNVSNKNKYAGKVKCFFWIIVAILFSLGLGQLK